MSNPNTGPAMDEPWWESFYDDAFADVVMAAGEDEAARAAAAFLVEKLRLRPGDTVFDQCCGLGRISIPLARRGLRVIGVDRIESYVRRAAAAAAEHGLDCEFHAGDAFHFVPERPCNGAFNWWSSFGYAERDALNREMLRRAFEALEPGGRFALDYYSVPRLLREFQDRVEIRYRAERGDFPVTRAARLDFAAGMVEQEWSYTDPGGTAHQKRSRTKLYLPHALRDLLLECGFRDVELYGDAGGGPFTLESPRCMLVACKPRET